MNEFYQLYYKVMSESIYRNKTILNDYFASNNCWDQFDSYLNKMIDPYR